MKRFLSWVVAGMALGLLLVGSAGYSSPYDLVPQGDWTYDLLARWAAQGLVTAGRSYSAREFHGDEPRTRGEMADLIVALAQHPETLPPGEVVFLEDLLREFAPEIRLARQDPSALIRAAEGVRKSRPRDDASWVARGTGFGMLRAGDSSSDGGTVRGVYRAAALLSVTSRLMVATSLTNDRQLSSDDPKAFPILEHYVVRWHTGFADWELGKTSNRWGPGFGGTMLLSDNAPALFQLNGKKTFSLGFLGHSYTFEQFAATLNEPGGRRYVVARRLSRPFGRRAGMSISEAIKSASTRDFPLALIMPLYLYNHTVFTDQEKAQTVNYLAGGDIWYAPSKAVQLYGDLVIDDITTPLGLGYSVPRKIGFLLGLHFPGMNRGRTDVRLEWALTDGEKPGSNLHEGGTYIHRNPSLSWYIDGLPMGHPMGTNRRGPFVRVQHRFGRRLTTIGEWESELQWRATPLVGDRRRAMLYAAYDLHPNRSVGIRLERTGGALGRDTLGEVQGSYSF